MEAVTGNRRIKLDSAWLGRLVHEFEKPYMAELRAFLLREKKAGKVIYPRGEDMFAALNSTPFEEIKVVILGQDPYHGFNQAHGLSFSVLPGVPIPPSLSNIYRELRDDLGIAPVRHGWLMPWAREGVLLLNSVLSVEHGKPASHRNCGWETFTDKIVHLIDSELQEVVFILWGSYAQRKAAHVDANRHLLLSAPHPSPLSASRGFFGSRPFSRTNNWLRNHGKNTINWRLPSSPSSALSGSQINPPREYN